MLKKPTSKVPTILAQPKYLNTSMGDILVNLLPELPATYTFFLPVIRVYLHATVYEYLSSHSV